LPQAKPAVKAIVDDIRSLAVARGRQADDIKVLLGATVITGRTDAEAQDKYMEYQRYVSSEAALAHAAASLGIDFAKYDLDEPIDAGKSQAIVSNVEAMTRAAGPQWTKRKLLEQMVLGSRQAPLVGSAERVADELIAWTQQAGVDGFNLSRTVAPECFEDFIALVVPILQERGAYKSAYRSGSLREKLFGHALLPASHAAAQFRFK
jgi:alkanesulfonate monooxygenase SsuD/methylene tetrahydromethanopterin reductase-like flavin-dependent oxidoreductase (luciferase family)